MTIRIALVLLACLVLVGISVYEAPAETTTAAGIAQFWADRILARPASSESMDALTEFVADGRSWTTPLPAEERDTKSRYVAAVCTMTPEFMLH